MNINEAIYGRRSTREYTTETVDEVVIGRLIDAAVQAPSAVNQQTRTAICRRVAGDAGTSDVMSMQGEAGILVEQDEPRMTVASHPPSATMTPCASC